MKIKTINDYVEILHEKYPSVSAKDIKKILRYGWKQVYLVNSYGGDLLIQDLNIWAYFGQLTNNSLKHFKYYAKKLALRIRILYRRKKIPWDGYYYFALNDKQYNDYLALKKKKGRPKKWFNFKNVFLYLILDECKLLECDKKYIFRIPYASDIKFKFFIKDLNTDKAELFIERNPMKFEDMCISNNNYEVI